MKRIRSVICVFMLVLSLCGCGSTVRSMDDMLQVITTQEHVTGDLQATGMVERENYTFVAAVSGQTEQESRFYAAEFSNLGDGTYSFAKMVPLTACGWQNAFCRWKDGYVFICNNNDAACLQVKIYPADGESSTHTLDVEKTPWVYFYQLPDLNQGYRGEFVFLDSEGNEIA